MANIQEGDTVAGRGVLQPDGTYANPTVPTTPAAPVNPTAPISTAPASSIDAALKAPISPITKDAQGNPISGGTITSTTPAGTGGGNTATISYDKNATPATDANKQTAPYGNDPITGVPYGAPGSNNPNPNANYSAGTNSNGLSSDQQTYESTIKSFSDKVDGILNGTTPLSAGEQAQVDGLKQQYENLIQQQQSVNKNNEGSAQIRGFQTGTAEFDRSFQANTIGSIVSAGATKIANLQAQEAAAVADLTSSLQKNDIANIKSAYDLYTSSHADVAKSIADTVAATQQAMKDASVANVISSGVTDPKSILATLQKQGYTNITAKDITDAISNLSPDAKAIMDLAKTYQANGADAATVAAVMASKDYASALKIGSQGSYANSAVMDMMTKNPDAGIIPSDTIAEANAKIQASPSVTAKAKADAADLAYKQAETAKIFADIKATEGSPTQSGTQAVTMTSGDIPDPIQQKNFLSTLSPDLATTVKAIADYDQSPSSIPTKQYKGVGALNQQQVLALVKQYDPTYSESNYANRQAYIKSVQSGPISQAVASANKSINHLLAFNDSVTKIGNGGISSALNQPWNSLTQLANPSKQQAVKTAQTEANGVKDELAKFFKGTGTSDVKSIDDWSQALNVNATPGDQKGTVQGAITLLAGQLDVLNQQYQQTMGKAPGNTFLQPQTVQKLSNLKNNGFQVDIPGVYYTDKSAYLKNGGSNDALTKAYQDLVSANDPNNPATPENILELAQIQSQ